MPEIEILVEVRKSVPGLKDKMRKALSERSDMTVTEFCDRIIMPSGEPMSRGYWYAVVEGKTALRIETLRKIEEVLETDFGVEL